MSVGSETVDQIKAGNKQTARDLDIECKHGETCGAPHRSLTSGMKRLMLNQELIAGHIVQTNGGASLKFGALKVSAQNGRDLMRIVGFFVIVYVFLHVTELLPERFRIGTPADDISIQNRSASSR